MRSLSVLENQPLTACPAFIGPPRRTETLGQQGSRGFHPTMEKPGAGHCPGSGLAESLVAAGFSRENYRVLAGVCAGGAGGGIAGAVMLASTSRLPPIYRIAAHTPPYTRLVENTLAE